METTRAFPLRAVLTITTGKLLCEVGELCYILSWMTDDNLYTHQLPRARRECAPWLRRWLPTLAVADAMLPWFTETIERYPYAAAETCSQFVADVARRAGLPLTLAVQRIPRDDHERINPYDEMVQMRGTDEGIVLVNILDKDR